MQLLEAVPSQGPARNTHEDSVSIPDTLSKVPCKRHDLPKSWPGSKDGKENRSDKRAALAPLGGAGSPHRWEDRRLATDSLQPRAKDAIKGSITHGTVSSGQGTRHLTEREGTGQSTRAFKRTEFLG